MKTNSQPETTLHSFNGWALERATRFDRQGSRGLIANIISASPLKRQAAFAVLASIDPDDSAPLSEIYPETNDLSALFRTRLARDLIAAAFRVDSVPSSYLRALIRIGHKPLSEPYLYRRLYDLLTDETQHEKADALRYCGSLDATRIRAVDLLDPVLVLPEVLRFIRNPDHVRQSNTLVGFVRETCSGMTDKSLRDGIRHALSAGDSVEEYAQKALQKADRFPPPPLSYHPDLQPITSGAEMVRIGKLMRNCLSTKIATTALGLSYYYKTEIDDDGEKVPVIVELAPLSNGSWYVDGLYAYRNQRVPPIVAIPLLRKLIAAGAVVGMNPDPHPKARELSRALSVGLRSSFDLLALEDGGTEIDDEDDDLESEFAAVLNDMERGFGFVA